MILLTKLLGILFPIILFLFRYILPAQFEKALSERSKEKKQILVELIHFPNELLIVSIGYTIPKTIEYLQQIIENNANSQVIGLELLFNVLFSLIVIGLLPFCIARTKIVEKYYFSRSYFKAGVQEIIIYLISIISIIISLILGV